MDILETLHRLLEEESYILSPRTIKGYRVQINQFGKWLKSKELSNIFGFEREQAELFLYTFSNAKTRTTYKSLIGRLFQKMVDRNQLQRNPFDKIRIKKTESQGKRAFTDTEKKKIMAYAKKNDSELYMFVSTMYYTLARPNELRNLKIKDIDLDKDIITVCSDISKNRYTRHITIPTPFKQMLTDYISGVPSDYYLFLGTSKPLGKNYFYNHLKRAMQKLKIDSKDTSLYSWKHTGTVDYYNETKDTYSLMQQLGHHSLEQTEVYLKSKRKQVNESVLNNFPKLD